MRNKQSKKFTAFQTCRSVDTDEASICTIAVFTSCFFVCEEGALVLSLTPIAIVFFVLIEEAAFALAAFFAAVFEVAVVAAIALVVVGIFMPFECNRVTNSVSACWRGKGSSQKQKKIDVVAACIGCMAVHEIQKTMSMTNIYTSTRYVVRGKPWKSESA